MVRRYSAKEVSLIVDTFEWVLAPEYDKVVAALQWSLQWCPDPKGDDLSPHPSAEVTATLYEQMADNSTLGKPAITGTKP